MRKTRTLHVAILALGAIANGSPISAAEPSVLGLPSPRDPDRPGAVMLHGGGRVTEATYERFIELAGGKNARIVLVPSAGYRRVDYSSDAAFQAAVQRRYGSWFRRATSGEVRNVTLLHTDDPDDSNSQSFTKPLETASGVWFSGGAQSRLNYRYVGVFPRKTRVQEMLRDVVKRGGIVGGTSAGMAAMPEIMAINESRQSIDGPIRLVAAHGLGLFDGAIVEQHFDGRGGRLERFTGLLRDSERLDRLAGRRGAGARMIGLAAEGSTAIILRSDQLEAIGNGDVHVFTKSPDDRTISWHTLKPGETATLRRDGDGRAALVSQQ